MIFTVNKLIRFSFLTEFDLCYKIAYIHLNDVKFFPQIVNEAAHLLIADVESMQDLSLAITGERWYLLYFT